MATEFFLQFQTVSKWNEIEKAAFRKRLQRPDLFFYFFCNSGKQKLGAFVTEEFLKVFSLLSSQQITCEEALRNWMLADWACASIVLSLDRTGSQIHFALAKLCADGENKQRIENIFSSTSAADKENVAMMEMPLQPLECLKKEIIQTQLLNKTRFDEIEVELLEPPPPKKEKEFVLVNMFERSVRVNNRWAKPPPAMRKEEDAVAKTKKEIIIVVESSSSSEEEEEVKTNAKRVRMENIREQEEESDEVSSAMEEEDSEESEESEEEEEIVTFDFPTPLEFYSTVKSALINNVLDFIDYIVKLHLGKSRMNRIENRCEILRGKVTALMNDLKSNYDVDEYDDDDFVIDDSEDCVVPFTMSERRARWLRELDLSACVHEAKRLLQKGEELLSNFTTALDCAEWETDRPPSPPPRDFIAVLPPLEHYISPREKDLFHRTRRKKRFSLHSNHKPVVPKPPAVVLTARKNYFLNLALAPPSAPPPRVEESNNHSLVHTAAYTSVTNEHSRRAAPYVALAGLPHVGFDIPAEVLFAQLKCLNDREGVHALNNCFRGLANAGADGACRFYAHCIHTVVRKEMFEGDGGEDEEIKLLSLFAFFMCFWSEAVRMDMALNFLIFHQVLAFQANNRFAKWETAHRSCEIDSNLFCWLSLLHTKCGASWFWNVFCDVLKRWRALQCVPRLSQFQKISVLSVSNERFDVRALLSAHFRRSEKRNEWSQLNFTKLGWALCVGLLRLDFVQKGSHVLEGLVTDLCNDYHKVEFDSFREFMNDSLWHLKQLKTSLGLDATSKVFFAYFHLILALLFTNDLRDRNQAMLLCTPSSTRKHPQLSGVYEFFLDEARALVPQSMDKVRFSDKVYERVSHHVRASSGEPICFEAAVLLCRLLLEGARGVKVDQAKKVHKFIAKIVVGGDVSTFRKESHVMEPTLDIIMEVFAKGVEFKAPAFSPACCGALENGRLEEVRKSPIVLVGDALLFVMFMFNECVSPAPNALNVDLLSWMEQLLDLMGESVRAIGKDFCFAFPCLFKMFSKREQFWAVEGGLLASLLDLLHRYLFEENGFLQTALIRREAFALGGINALGEQTEDEMQILRDLKNRIVSQMETQLQQEASEGGSNKGAMEQRWTILFNKLGGYFCDHSIRKFMVNEWFKKRIRENTCVQVSEIAGYFYLLSLFLEGGEKKSSSTKSILRNFGCTFTTTTMDSVSFEYGLIPSRMQRVILEYFFRFYYTLSGKESEEKNTAWLETLVEETFDDIMQSWFGMFCFKQHESMLSLFRLFTERLTDFSWNAASTLLGRRPCEEEDQCFKLLRAVCVLRNFLVLPPEFDLRTLNEFLKRNDGKTNVVWFLGMKVFLENQFRLLEPTCLSISNCEDIITLLVVMRGGRLFRENVRLQECPLQSLQTFLLEWLIKNEEEEEKKNVRKYVSILSCQVYVLIVCDLFFAPTSPATKVCVKDMVNKTNFERTFVRTRLFHEGSHMFDDIAYVPNKNLLRQFLQLIHASFPKESVEGKTSELLLLRV